MSNPTALTVACLALVLTACPKKDDSIPDAGMVAPVVMEAAAPVATTETVDAAAPLAPAVATAHVAPKVVDAGQPAVVDAGPAVQQCCCNVAGMKGLAGQSECLKIKKGVCVKMKECK